MPTFDTPDPISVTIELFVGNAQIIASDRADTVVEVRPGDSGDESDVKAAEQTRVEYSGGTLLVRAPKARPLASLANKTRAVDVVVELPTGSQVHASMVAGDLSGAGQLGECRYKSSTGHVRLERTGPLHVHTTGNVTVDQVLGNAEVSTGSGRLRVGQVTGTAVFKNSNGAIEIAEVGGAARARSSNGDIAIGRPVGDVEARTANGSIRIGEAVRGSIVVETGYGDLAVNVAEGTAARLDVKTGYGRVRRSLEPAEGPESSDETVEVRARTSYGDIVIGRS